MQLTRLGVRKQGDFIRIVMYSCYTDKIRNEDRFFDMQAPLNDKEKLATLFEAAKSKGLSLPTKDKEKKWW